DAPQGVEDVPPLRSGDILHPLRGLLLPSILGREITPIGLHFYLESIVKNLLPPSDFSLLFGDNIIINLYLRTRYIASLHEAGMAAANFSLFTFSLFTFLMAAANFSLFTLHSSLFSLSLHKK
ncbi:MAG: hypothetical protein IJ928_04320, partial [Prevotella sp.]|nr:hypothetical protein [Prevotella sp.]